MGQKWYESVEQHVLLEYASLKSRCPDGIYITPKSGTHLQWYGTLFVRKGPYAPAILRFNVVFPWDYPRLPPSLTFSTDIFHPLVTPLTTYTYSTSSRSSDTVSASDDERLPPGSFSLRHGFPSWFSRSQNRQHSTTELHEVDHKTQSPFVLTETLEEDSDAGSPISASLSQSSPTLTAAKVLHGATDRAMRKAGVFEVLEYVKRSFDEDDFLDTLPLEAAGNVGAWKAWRAHRSNSGVSLQGSSTVAMDNPEEWKWDGVWEQRVMRGINTSISDSALFGSGSEDDGPRFLVIDDDFLSEIKSRILKP